MSSVKEAFERWRGKKKASAAYELIDTAQQIQDYVALQACIIRLKAEYDDPYSRINTEFQDNKALSILLYAKLSLDEFGQAMSHYESSKEAELAGEINEILVGLYDHFTQNSASVLLNQFTQKINIKQQIFELITKLNQLIDRLPNSKQPTKAKALCLSSYFMLLIAGSSLERLSDVKKMALSAVGFKDKILDELKIKITNLLIKVNATATSLEHPMQACEELTADIGIQGYLNSRYSELLDLHSEENSKVTAVQKEIKSITSELIQLIECKTAKSNLSEKIELLSTLQDALIENDELLTNRQYVWPLIEANRAAFDLLMSGTSIHNQHLRALLERARTPNLVSSTLLILSKATSWLTYAYRYATPQLMQNYIQQQAPATLDSQCKTLLKDLNSEYIGRLKVELGLLNKTHTSTISRLANTQADLVPLLANESGEQLKQVIEQQNELGQLLLHYEELRELLMSKKIYLANIACYDQILTEFIQLNNGFLVKLSNFFARFSLLFKSSTAEMIDAARSMSLEISELSDVYQDQIAAEEAYLSQLEIPIEGIKEQEALSIEPEKASTFVVSKETVATMIQLRQTLLHFDAKPKLRKDQDIASSFLMTC